MTNPLQPATLSHQGISSNGSLKLASEADRRTFRKDDERTISGANERKDLAGNGARHRKQLFEDLGKK
jgi:hypothetical protein